MSNDLERQDVDDFRPRLEALRKQTDAGSSYWFGRDISAFLGYTDWRNFESVVEKAWRSLEQTGVDPSHHVVETTRMMRVGKGASREVSDLFLSRAACYLVAMNGDPKKEVVAAAQMYFAVKARQKEVIEDNHPDPDQKRLEQREKVTKAFKTVSGTAIDAGVESKKLGIFHDQRYQGMYGQSRKEMMQARGIQEKENPFDRMGTLELSANEFQMNLAAETIAREGIRNEKDAFRKNKAIGERVRSTMIESGSPPPESLPIAEPIKLVKKRLKQQSGNAQSNLPGKQTSGSPPDDNNV